MTDHGAEQDDESLGRDGVLPVTLGTIAWAIAFFVLLGFRDRLEANDAEWWLWVCVTGFALGVVGTWYVRRRRGAYRRNRAARAVPEGPDDA